MAGLRVSNKDILELIATIYDAALEPQDWRLVVEKLQQHLPGTGVALHGTHNGPNAAYFLEHQGYDPATIKEFLEDYAAINPWPELMQQITPGEIVITDACRFTDEVHNTEYYSFLRHRNIASGVGASMCLGSDRTFFLGVDYASRDAPAFNRPIADLIAKLAPHLARSFEISHRTASARSGFGSLSDMIERLASPAFVVERNLRVRRHNRAGGDLLAEGCGLRRLGQEQLTLEDRNALCALRKAVCAATHVELMTAAPASIAFKAAAAAVPGRITVVPLCADGSLSRGALESFLAQPERLALLIVTPGSGREKILTELYQTGFGFTPAQASLAVALCQGSSLRAYAATRKIAMPTARNHLQALFEKTDTHRQSELVALLLESAASW